MTLLRRRFLHLFAGAAAMPLCRLAQAQVSPTTSQRVRVATGLLATWQSTAWLGAEAGLFEKQGIELTLPAIAVGGPKPLPGSSVATGSSRTPALSLSRKKYSKAATL